MRPDARFDPFVLPSATSLRFVLLIIGAAVGAMYITLWQVALLELAGVPSILDPAACSARARADAGAVPDGVLLDDYLSCAAGQEKRLVVIMLGGAPVWAALTVVVYAAYPLLLRLRLRPIPVRDDDPRLLRAEGDLRAVLGDRGRERVQVLVTLGTAKGARAFGAFGRYSVAVDSTLLAARGDSDLDRQCSAMIRHEAAHLRNRDIDITYLTIGAWWSFFVLLALTMAAHAAVVATAPSAGEALSVIVVTLLPLAVAAVPLLLLQPARALVLRTREHYADVRAASSPGTASALRSAFAAMAEGRPRESVWQRARSYHPRPRDRAEVLRDPRRLARVRPADLLTAGLILGAGQPHLGTAGRLVTEGEERLGMLAVAVLLGAVVGVVVAAVVWNAVRAAAGDPPRLGRCAAFLAAGIAVGGSVPHPFVPWGWSSTSAAPVVTTAVSVLALWLTCLLFLAWSAMCARRWLSSSASPRLAGVLGLGCAGPVFGCLFALWVTFDGILGTFVVPGPSAVAMSLFGVGSVWPVPLAAGLMVGCVLAIPAQETRLAAAWVLRALGGVVVFFAFLVALAATAAGGASVLLALIVALTLVVAAAVSAALGARRGGRGRTGVVACAAGAMACAAGFLEPAAFESGIWAACLGSAGVQSCSAIMGNSLLTAYGSGGGLAGLAVSALMLVCVPAAVAGSAVRTGVDRRRRRGPGAWPGRPRSGLQAVAVAAVATAAVFVAAFHAGPVGAPLDPFGPEERRDLRASVVPGSTDGDEACQAVLGVHDSAARGDMSNESWSSTLVTLASSDDPALAAFGRAMLNGADHSYTRFFQLVDNYCPSPALPLHDVDASGD
ncbi:M48 family metalloprotease [Nocardiopsis sp. NRRL B-16309]|uniref:M48 family metalloprotease n=1 Tax=Nocardiopsis sp. NRRL B-16309 TaxID=1519494 RepID=UPI000B2EA929|nr:M48 family metalloprotease [Nocardiopsis sp. NRRL B-16309]